MRVKPRLTLISSLGGARKLYRAARAISIDPRPGIAYCCVQSPRSVVAPSVKIVETHVKTESVSTALVLAAKGRKRQGKKQSMEEWDQLISEMNGTENMEHIFYRLISAFVVYQSIFQNICIT